MSTPSSNTQEQSVLRSRRSHKKSRGGCRRCKERKIRCDERRPICSACERRNDTCSLQFITPGNAFRKGTVFKAILPAPESTTLLDLTEVAVIRDGLTTDVSTAYPSITFDLNDLAMFRHFERSTSASIGDERIQKAYRGQVLEMALEYPYLMHAILAMSQMHEHYLADRKSLLKTDLRFIKHWQQCLAQFSVQLAPKITGNTADAMMVTSTIINGIAFCILEDNRQESQWPLVSRDNDLSWLSVQKGISLVFRAATPFHESSKISYLFGPDTDHEDPGEPESELRPQDLMLFIPELAELCGITSITTAASNPYFNVLRNLAPLLQMPCTSETVFAHLSFLPSMDDCFIALLRARDHRALLILCYWYANISSYDCWWTNIRSKAEGTAICRYLSREADRQTLQLLRVPAKVFGVSLTRQQCSDVDKWNGDIDTFAPCNTM